MGSSSKSNGQEKCQEGMSESRLLAVLDTKMPEMNSICMAELDQIIIIFNYFEKDWFVDVCWRKRF
jgi:hypothetical protein